MLCKLHCYLSQFVMVMIKLSGLLFAPLIRISEVFIYEAGIELPVRGMKEGLVFVRLSNRTLL